MIRELSACCHEDRSRRKQARRTCRPHALNVRADEQFHKSRSEDRQTTLTRAPLFANLFFDRLAALGSRAVNARFRSLCFVALFDQVVDCRLLAYVPPVDTPWRYCAHSHSPRPVAAFSAFSCRSSQTPGLEGAAAPPGVPEAAAAAPQSAEAATVPVVSAGCLSASAFRADLPFLNSVYPCR